MNYLEMELSLRFWTILGGATAIVIILLAIWFANKYKKFKKIK